MANASVIFPQELALVTVQALMAKAKADKRKTIKIEDLSKVFEGIQIVPSNIPKSDEKKKRKYNKKDPNASKKKMSNYNRFQKAFILQHKTDFEKPVDVFKAAAAKWSSTKDNIEARNLLFKEYEIEVDEDKDSQSSDSGDLKSPPSPADNSSDSEDENEDDDN